MEVETRLHDLRQGNLSDTRYYNILSRYWQHLDMYQIYPCKCSNDTTLYKKIVEKRAIKFLIRLDKDLDEVRGRIIGTKPSPTLQEAF